MVLFLQKHSCERGEETGQVLTKSFWIAGFECSCHRRRDGRRLDVIEATRHDRHAAADYDRMRRAGMATARDGIRWHRVERSPGRYDPSSFLPMVRAARDAGVQVIWDLCHYGWPDDIDIFRPQFVDRFAEYAREVARVIANETGEPGFYCPINEISFWSWGGGDVAYLNPFATGRGFELKTQLVRASIAAIEAIWSVDPQARILHAEPAINVLPNPELPGKAGSPEEAEGNRLAQFQAYDMLEGRLWPQLGGEERYLDVVGVNFYPTNQWVLHGPMVPQGDRRYRPFRHFLREVWERYGRPVMVSETGAPGDERGPWLSYIGREVRAAQRAGVPVEGVCLYPILDYPGWDDDRHCETGLWGYADPSGEREPCLSLQRELERQARLTRREAPTNTNGSPDAHGVPEEELEHAAF